MKYIHRFISFNLNECLDIKPLSNVVYTQPEMVNMGGNYHLHHGILAMIPVSKISVLNPEPLDWHDDEGTTRSFRKGGIITKPIEVWYDDLNDKYMLYDGNHRVKQAKVNDDMYIKSFVQAKSKSIYNKLLA